MPRYPVADRDRIPEDCSDLVRIFSEFLLYVFLTEKVKNLYFLTRYELSLFGRRSVEKAGYLPLDDYSSVMGSGVISPIRLSQAKIRCPITLTTRKLSSFLFPSHPFSSPLRSSLRSSPQSRNAVSTAW